ncbi:hypothetical protein Hypma_001041 [Hypsizygus marmoreus]|uniref:Uncharacterized protein n=1 Tax=Hypsizygus marmoreus TaxID=39966 RepID=A0A369J861_HYPMA|nr:hypothetical protein Hypma_001041 [Hypsizygus marmoreus]
MAALYLHNAIHAPEPSSVSWSAPSTHQRNVSTVSNTTLHTSTSEFSHPTEPLLHSSTSEAIAYMDMLSRQPVHPGSRPHLGWTGSLSLEGDPITSRERKAFRDRFMKQRLRRLKLLKGLLEGVMGAFAVYNTIRYFLAFTIYDSPDGQTVSLAMGICTGASLAFMACAYILSIFQPHLLIQQIPLRTVLLSRTAFHALASFTLLAPALVNMVFLFMWKNSGIPELNVLQRCHVDIDVIWTASSSPCRPSGWVAWLALSIVRLVVTISIIILYHIIASKYHITRRPSLSRYPQKRRHSHGMPSETSLSPSMAGFPNLSFATPHHNHNLHRSSDSTLKSQSNSKYSSSQQHQTLTAAASSVYSDAEEGPSDSDHTHNQDSLANIENDAELISFRERFHSLVSQIARETEEGLELARSDTSLSPQQTNSVLSGERDLPPIPPTVGYDEFGRPYPPDEHIQILNGFVRRMPTIESMGSREMGSMGTSSMYTNGDTMTTSIRSIPLSRPPTRANTMSISEYSVGSQPPSRSNSISAGAEILMSGGRTSEIGELVDRAERSEGVDGRGSLNGSGYTSTGSSYPSTMSYYTATSYGSSALMPSERENSPPPPLPTPPPASPVHPPGLL